MTTTQRVLGRTLLIHVSGDIRCSSSCECDGLLLSPSLSRGQAAPGSAGLQARVEALQRELEGTRRELQGARDRKGSLERECVIYQSQLEVCVGWVDEA